MDFPYRKNIFQQHENPNLFFDGYGAGRTAVNCENGKARPLKSCHVLNTVDTQNQEKYVKK
jgi:hypothetical protein